MQFAKRLDPLQFNVFADMDRAKAQARAAGQNVIDLSLGSSDLPAAAHITDAIAHSLSDTSTHGYLLFNGTRDFREAAAIWYEQKFGIAVNPETEVLPLIGSQEGTAHMPLAVLNPGDFALLLDPGYPSHAGGVHLAGGQIYPMPLLAENAFLPIFEDIPPAVLAQSKMMVLSYPHNPTTAIAPVAFFEKAVAFCREHRLVLVHDFPYVDLVFDDRNSLIQAESGNEEEYRKLMAPSIFQADRDKSVAIEFFTLSKSYSMGGFRVGYAIGNSELIAALRQVKAAVDFNQYRGILNGAIAALTGSQDTVRNQRRNLQKTTGCLCKRATGHRLASACTPRHHVRLGETAGTLGPRFREILHSASTEYRSRSFPGCRFREIRRRLRAICLSRVASNFGNSS